MKTTFTLNKRVSLYVSFFLLVGFATLQGVAEAAVNMPALDRLTPLTDMVSAPADVALDKQGRVYVAETTKNRITVFSQSGRFTGKMLTAVAGPISVAVDVGGRILVGNARNGSVAVFGPNFDFLFKLGRGNGEFGKPTDIAIDTAGNIYVVDQSNHAINTYNASGTKTGSIGTPGNGDGQLHHPTSIAIDENAGELVVLDHQQILDRKTSKMVDGARIQYFSMNGVPLRAYSKFGYNNAGMDWSIGKTIYDTTMGQLTMPKQLTVDTMSRIYVTDARLQKVMVYDNYDNFLGTIDSVTSPLRLPMGITIDASSRLYVASWFTSKVEVFGVDEYTNLFITPPVVEFKTIENGTAPPAQTLTISNLGKASFNWTASTPDSWISFANTTGTLIATETASLDITVDPGGFAPGEYTGSVVIDTGAGASEVIKVVLTVETNPLQVAPGLLTFQTTVGTTAAGQQLAITTGTEGALLWNVSVDQPWISLNKTTGMTPDTIRVYADISSLDPGTYNGIITFVQQNDTPIPVEIPVSITLTETITPPEDHPVLGVDGIMWNKKWTMTQLLPGTALNGVAGTSKTDVFTVGENGIVLHFDGKDWTQMDSGTTNTLNSVWSSSKTNGYAVGAEGMVLNYNGTDWTIETPAGANGLRDVWGNSDTSVVTVGEFGSVLDSSFTSVTDLGVALRTVWSSTDNDVFVAGEAGTIFHYDGSNWTPMTSNSTELFNGIWGSSSSNVYAVGENGAIVHFDGTSWTAMDSGTTQTLNGICGTSARDIYIVGDNSLMLRYNGSEWSAMNVGAGIDLNDVWCTGKSDIFVVGDDGTIINGKSQKFPWLLFLPQIIDNAVKRKEKKEKKK